MVEFAKPVAELSPPVVASQPTQGQGLALDDTGRIPLTVRGTEEITQQQVTSNSGPTGVTTTGDGDLIANFPAASFLPSAHLFELFVQPQSNAGNELLYFRLHDGTAPGALVQEFTVRTPVTNPGNPVFLRCRFTPTEGIHTYQIRWRGDVGTYTLVNATVPLVARIVRV
jgi:hypothetical protein